MVLGDGRERLVGDAPYQQDLGRCQVLVHPTLEFGAGVAEVSRRPFAGGVPVEGDEQVRDELSHIDSFLVPSSGLLRTRSLKLSEKPHERANLLAIRRL